MNDGDMPLISKTWVRLWGQGAAVAHRALALTNTTASAGMIFNAKR